jgi:hypothetical protein
MIDPSVFIGGPLRSLARRRACCSKRLSSYDRSGGNADYLVIKPGQNTILGEIDGAGCITHIWMTSASQEPAYLRALVLRMWWDGEAYPSVEVPLGDFFGVGHGRTVNFSSLPLQMSPQDGRSFNCWFPMPFESGARIAVSSDCAEHDAVLYYHIDYEQHARIPADLLRFHAQWRRENPTHSTLPLAEDNFDAWYGGGVNTDGAENYTILEAEGAGHYVGCSLNIVNGHPDARYSWYGEGDEMIFIDGEGWPPSIHGTGTEDYAGSAWSPTQPFWAPYHGLPLAGGENYAGCSTLYRFHIEDPLVFERSIRVTIEHGHANHRADDVSSTAYWYQTEPHAPFPPLLPVEARLPRE